MDSQQAKVLIEKIQALHRTIHAGGNRMAPIERDLMLNYIRQLYEIYFETGSAERSVVSSMTPEPPKEEPKPQPEPPKKPRIIEISDTMKDWLHEEKPAPTPPPVIQPAPEKVEFVPKPTPKKEEIPGEFEKLFEFKEVRELSEKLSESPINDLTRGLAINDRLLYTNELFGKDPVALNESLKALNRYDSLSSAKGFLLNLATQYNWNGKEKLATAQEFIRYVRRRYISR